MCDYSLHLVASRPAKVGDRLVSTDFAKSVTRGFSAVGEPHVAVCLSPGTEVAFEKSWVEYDRAGFSLFGTSRVEHSTAIFRQVDMNDSHAHHDALEFPNGKVILVARLRPGQRATVLQLPAKTAPEKPKSAAAATPRAVMRPVDIPATRAHGGSPRRQIDA